MEAQRIDEQDDSPLDSGTLAVITAAEIDTQIATARKFPRHTTKAQQDSVRREVLELATRNPEVAGECFYAVPRDGKTITGGSIRFAEIVASRWGNCRAGARIVAEERDHIVAQGIFHDLETNAAVTREIKRRITGRGGKRYSADMIATTGNAACAIALRNAVFAGVPRAYWEDILGAVRKYLVGDAATLADRRAQMFAAMQKMGATEAMVLRLLSRVTPADVTGDDLVTMRAVFNSIRDGERTVDEVFSAQPAATVDAKPSTQQQTDEEPGNEAKGNEPPPAADAPKKRTRAKKGDEPADAPAPAADAKPGPKLVKDEPVQGTAAPAAQEAAAALNAELAKKPLLADDGKPLATADAAKEGSAVVPWVNEEGDSVLPLNESTPCWTGVEPITAKPSVDGTLLWNGEEGRYVMQWQNGKWIKYADQDSARDFVVLHLRRRITQAMRRDRLDRDAANKRVAELLGLAKPPTAFNELSFAQLVAVVAKVSG